MANRSPFCTNNKTHSRFRAAAVVEQEWLVDRYGEKIEVLDPESDIQEFPIESSMTWECHECGGRVHWRDPEEDPIDAMAEAVSE